MAKSMSTIFQGFNPGDKCTGTIGLFGLRSSDLARKGMIELRGDDWVFLSDTPQDIEEDEEITDDAAD